MRETSVRNDSSLYSRETKEKLIAPQFGHEFVEAEILRYVQFARCVEVVDRVEIPYFFNYLIK